VITEELENVADATVNDMDEVEVLDDE